MSAIAIRLSYFESGVLLALLEQADQWKPNEPLHNLYKQLVSIKKQIEEEIGVKKELLSDGRIRITDNAGNIIIRPPAKWETEGYGET